MLHQLPSYWKSTSVIVLKSVGKQFSKQFYFDSLQSFKHEFARKLSFDLFFDWVWSSIWLTNFLYQRIRYWTAFGISTRKVILNIISSDGKMKIKKTSPERLQDKQCLMLLLWVRQRNQLQGICGWNFKSQRIELT